jgi:hypothetical protein
MKANWPVTLLYIALGGMQLSWLLLPVLILNRKWGDSLSRLGIFLFFPIAFSLSRILRNGKRMRKHSLPICGIAGIAAYGGFLALERMIDPFGKAPAWLSLIVRSVNPQNPEFFLLVTASLLWALGYRLGSMKVSFASFLSEFQFGLPILFIALLVEQKLEMNTPHLAPLIMLFFFFALLGAGIAHGRDHAGWVSSPNLSSWIGFLMVAIALVLSAGLFIALLASPSFVQLLLSLLYEAGRWALEILEQILRFLAGLLPLPDSTLPLPPVPSRPAPKPDEGLPFVLFSDSVREILRILWTLMVLSVALVALWRVSSQILDWLRRRMGKITGEEAEPLPGAFRSDLRILLTWILDALTLKWIFHWLRMKRRRDRRTNSIRHIYAQLLKWSEKKGCRRERAETPFDYLPRLIELVPEAGPDFTFITHQYVQARYGSLPLPADRFVKARDGWHNIQRIETRQKRRQKKNRESTA